MNTPAIAAPSPPQPHEHDLAPALRAEIASTLAAHGFTDAGDDIALAQAFERHREQWYRRRALRASSPRELVLAWCLWLLGSWTVAYSLDSAVPAVRWMVYASLVGMMVLWPAYRLSQGCPQADRGARDAGHEDELLHASAAWMSPGLVLRDWFCLLIVFQSVIWPLRITTQWGVVQTLWLDAAVAAWSLVAAALIAWGCRSCRGRERTVAMLLCLLLLLGEPLVMYLANQAMPPGGDGGAITWTMRISPIVAIWGLTDVPAGFSSRPWAAGVLSVALAALAAWAMVALMAARDRARFARFA